MTSLEEIFKELEKRTNISRQELEQRIEEKQKSLSGLVSKEGAAYLIAKELGIDILDKVRRKLEIKNVVAGMKKVNIVGKVFKISNIVEFTRKNGEKGKVVNIFLGDSTGHVRLPLWNDQVRLIEDGQINIGDVIQVINAFARENVYGDIEISIGKYGSIRPVEEKILLPSVEELLKNFLSPVKKSFIKNISEGEAEIKGTIVNVFPGSFIFDVCEVCGSSLDSGKCLEHKEAGTKPEIVVSSIVDDTTGTLRVVFFRDIAEKICGITAEELSRINQEERQELMEERLIGKEIILRGRVKKNKIFDRLEMIVNDFEEINILKEAKDLLSRIQLKVGG